MRSQNLSKHQEKPCLCFSTTRLKDTGLLATTKFRTAQDQKTRRCIPLIIKDHALVKWAINQILPPFLDIRCISFVEKVQNIGCIALQHSSRYIFQRFDQVSLFLANPSVSLRQLASGNPVQTWCNFPSMCVL